MKHGLLIVTFAMALGMQSAAFAASSSVLDDKSSDKSTTSDKSSSTDMTAKKAKAKECSDKADAKGLHGEARKKFRSECKKEK